MLYFGSVFFLREAYFIITSPLDEPKPKSETLHQKFEYLLMLVKADKARGRGWTNALAMKILVEGLTHFD